MDLFCLLLSKPNHSCCFKTVLALKLTDIVHLDVNSCVGYYGDALALQKGDCTPCECYLAGTEVDGSGPPICDQLSGQCQCKSHVTGTYCEQCQPGYYNIVSGEVSNHVQHFMRKSLQLLDDSIPR